MSSDIKGIIESYIQREQSLIYQLSKIQSQRTDVRAEIGKDIIRLAARELFGRTGGKITRTLLNQSQKERLRFIEAEIERQHQSLLQSLRDFLSSISVWKRDLKEPNSHTLLDRLDKAQEYLRVSTRIRHTVKALRSIASKRLIYNKNILMPPSKEIIIPSGKPFSGAMELKKLLSAAKRRLKIMDPYVDELTLELLLAVPENVPIKLLTAYTGGPEKERRFLRACRRFQAERPSFEIRKCDPKLIHDRFILTENQGWSVGSSLKDFGKKLSAITRLSDEVKRKTEQIYEEIWKKSKSLLN